MVGHPLHPAVVHFPLGLLFSATVADIAWLAGLTGDVHVGAIMMAGGLAAGLVAMAFGMIDFTTLEEPVVPYALQHIGAVGVAWLGYAIALYLRRDILTGGSDLGTASIAISLISALVLAAGGWLGGRLVYTFGANVRKVL
jgi:uncharacterized membrane protein